MRQTVIRPRWVPKDEPGIADFGAAGTMRYDAERGSAKLLAALMGAYTPSPRAKRLSRSKNDYRHFTWETRKHQAAQIRRMQDLVAAHFKLDAAVMTAKARGSQEVSETRQIAMFLARKVVGASYPDIGKCFGGRDHTTVIHACQRVETNPRLAADASEIRRVIGA